MRRRIAWIQLAGALAAAHVTFSAAGATGSEQITQGFPASFAVHLARNKEIYVATDRHDGTRSSAVPVWFAVIDDAIWFATDPNSKKARRIQHGSPMYVSVEGKNGPFLKTKAEVVKDGAMADQLGEIYGKKYWTAWLGLFRPSRARVDSGKIVLIRLTPAQ